MRVVRFAIDDENADKFWAHGLTSRQVRQVLQNDFIIVRNRGGRRAPYVAIGRDHGGQCITIPIEATADPVVWRPVTASRCKGAEELRLARHARP